jgi:hypothetical protein
MLLSPRPPAAAADIPSPHQDKSFSNIISGLRARSSLSASTTPRLPLAMLDPQSVNHHPGEMSSASSTTSAAYLIGRPISNARTIADIEAEATENRTTMYVYDRDSYRKWRALIWTHTQIWKCGSTSSPVFEHVRGFLDRSWFSHIQCRRCRCRPNPADEQH